MKIYLLLIFNIILISLTIYLIIILSNKIKMSKMRLNELNHKIDEQTSLLKFETQVCPAKDDNIESGKAQIDTLRNEVKSKRELLEKLKQK